MKRGLAPAAAFALALALVAGPALAQEGGMIHIGDRAFIPRVTNATAGEIVVMNFDPVRHSVTARDGSFDVELPAAPESNFTEARFEVRSPGTFEFACRYHLSMTGTLVVAGAAPTADTSTTTPKAESPGFGAFLAALALIGAAAAARGRPRR